MVTNKLKEKIIQRKLLHVIRSFFLLGFRFQYQLINLVWLCFDFFHLAEAYLLFRGFILLCVELPKNITKYLSFIIIHIFSTHFAINLFFCTTWKRKETIEQQPHRACEGTKSKQKTKPSHVAFKLTTRSIVRFLTQKMQWYHEGIASLSDVRVERKISCQ